MKNQLTKLATKLLAIAVLMLMLSCGSNNEEGVKTGKRKNYTERIEGINIDMVYVKGGTFMMGATEEQGSDAGYKEYPLHQVTLDSYYIGKYEVTQAQWEAIMGNNPSGVK